MITNKIKYETMSRETVDGKRLYLTPNGERLPSVTTILDITKPEEKKQLLNSWKKRVGEKKAQEITTEAANRGTRMHSYLESYIQSDQLKPYPSNPYAQASWFMAAEIILKGLENVNEFWGNEVALYYSGLYAGTTDCVGVWKGCPAIIDFKQTNKPKKREWIDDYFLQLLFYGTAHNKMFGTNISTGVICMACQPVLLEDGNYSTPEYQEFEISGAEWTKYESIMWKRIEQYYQVNT